MKLRNAFAIVIFLWICLDAATGQAPTEVSPSVDPPSSPPDLRVRVTGYLLGYYRVPNFQPEDFLENCPDPADPQPSPAAKLLLQELAAQNSDHSLLVGMGDNFAVELGSRTYGSPVSGLRPKQRNPGPLPSGGRPGDDWPPVSENNIGDNVGCFFSLAGYDAIVPGKEDFYFGPERLQRIAQRLAALPNPAAGDSPAYHPVPMLAANLIVKTDFWEKPDKIPDFEHKDLTFGFPEKVESKEITDHGTVLPFLQTITIKILQKQDDKPTLGAWLCEIPKGVDPATVVASCVQPNNTATLSLTPRRRKKPEQSAEGDTEFTITADIPVGKLVPDRNFGLYLQMPSKTQTKTYCVRFTVARPFLQPIRCTQNCSDKEPSRPYATPYAYKPESNAVIFGVVDPDLKGAIGRDNISWKNQNSRYSTSVDFLDPAPALHQAMQLFLKDAEAHGIDARGVRKVLLAQMTRAKAEQLALRLSKAEADDDNLYFDIVFSMASDYDRSSPDGTLEIRPRDVKKVPRYPSIVITPVENLFQR
jgi:hypothetical protein